jgi:hypothetical protein
VAAVPRSSECEPGRGRSGAWMSAGAATLNATELLRCGGESDVGGGPGDARPFALGGPIGRPHAQSARLRVPLPGVNLAGALAGRAVRVGLGGRGGQQGAQLVDLLSGQLAGVRDDSANVRFVFLVLDSLGKLAACGFYIGGGSLASPCRAGDTVARFLGL